MEPPADAYLIVAERVHRVGFHAHGLVAPPAHANRAAHAAGGADGRHPVLSASEPLVRLLHERGCWANVNAGAAEVTVRFVDRAARSKRDPGGEPAAGQRDGTRVAQIITGADAAGADDAHLRIELQKGVSAVRLRLLRLVVGAILRFPRLNVVFAHIQQIVGGLEFATIVL